MTIKPLLKYPGSKWIQAKLIVPLLPAHKTYIEPYFGSGAVFFLKKPSDYEIINDQSKSIINLFKVIRSQGDQLAALIDLTPWSRDEYYESYLQTGDSLEDARRFLVRCWQAHGTRLNQRTGWRNRGSAQGGATTTLWQKLPDRILSSIDRLKDAEIENVPAVALIERYNDQSDCLIYADPPYPLSTRGGRKLYADEMTDADHIILLDTLDKHPGPVVLSGYAHPLYDQRLAHWDRIEMTSLAEKGQIRTEVIWRNQQAVTQQQLTMFYEDR